jgi:hypothetical protein
MSTSLCRPLLLLSLVAFAACLPMDAFCLGGYGCSEYTSWKVLAYGWIAMLMIPHAPHLIWLAIQF